MGRAEDNKKAKRERIIVATRELLSSHGFDGTTMDAVAERAGVSKGALFFHYGSKQGLLNRVFEVDFIAWIDDAFADPPAGHVLDRLVTVYSALLLAMCSQPDLTRIYMSAAGTGDHGGDHVHRAMDRLLDRTAQLLDDAIACGEIKPAIDSTQLAYNLWALYFVEQHLWLLDTPDDPSSAADRLRAVFALQIIGLLNPGEAHDAATAVCTDADAHRWVRSSRHAQDDAGSLDGPD